MTEEDALGRSRATWRREKLASMAWELFVARAQGNGGVLTQGTISTCFYEADLFLAEVEKREI